MIETKNAGSLAELAEGDSVSHPGHYAGDGAIECMDAMRSMMSGDQYALPPQAAYWWGCAFKYLWRWRRKGGVYEKHFVGLNETTTYVVRDLSGVDVESFRYKLYINPDMLLPFELDVVDGGQ